MKTNRLIISFLYISIILAIINLFTLNYSYQETINKIMRIVMSFGLILLFSRNFITWVFSLVCLIPCIFFFSYELFNIIQNSIYNSRTIFLGICLVCCCYAVFYVLKYLFTTDKKG
jgi:hypothetical protein